MAPFFLRGTSTSEDGDSSTDLGIGLRYGTFDGVNGIVATASFVYGEANGTETENRLMAGVDYRHNFADALFGFAKEDLHSTVWPILPVKQHGISLLVQAWITAS